MNTLTITDVPEETLQALQECARGNNRSVEAEVLAILQAAITPSTIDLFTVFEEIRAQTGGFELDLFSSHTAAARHVA